MLKYFRNKKSIYQDGFNDGYECHKAMADRKIKNLKKKIRRQNKEIKEIKLLLSGIAESFRDARDYAIQLDKLNKIQLFEATREYQENKIIASNILQYCRSYEKQLPKIDEKIMRYKN